VPVPGPLVQTFHIEPKENRHFTVPIVIINPRFILPTTGTLFILFVPKCPYYCKIILKINKYLQMIKILNKL